MEGRTIEGGIAVNDTKICPIFAAGANNDISAVYCIRQDCAWWAEWANDCSIPLIAGMFADSTICQNVFKIAKPPKEEA